MFQHIMDERYAAIDVVGKGLVIFSAYVFLIESWRPLSHTDTTIDVPMLA